MFGLVFIVAGLAFKLGAVPFHMWVPDVYQGAPTAVTLLIGGAPKLAAFCVRRASCRKVWSRLPQMVEGMLVILAGCCRWYRQHHRAIAQTNLKRMLAYSTISHMGFLVLGILAGTPGWPVRPLFYAVVYVLMSLAGACCCCCRAPGGLRNPGRPEGPGTAKQLVRLPDAGGDVLHGGHSADGGF